MGYRFQLVSGIFPPSVTAGTIYSAQVTLNNTGVAPLYNSRPVQVILRNGGTLTTFAQAQIDPRRWAPGIPSTFNLTFTVPAGQAAGTYDVILNLTDATTDQPLARILLSNGGGVHEASTRLNVLGQVVIVSSLVN